VIDLDAVATPDAARINFDREDEVVAWCPTCHMWAEVDPRKG